MINITHLTAGYGNHPVLSGLNLHMKAGKITAVIGPNGSGKSTLIKCLARQLPRMGGEILVCGKSIDSYAPKDYAKRVSYLKQTRDVPMITAESLVLHGRFPHMGFPRKYTDEDRAWAKKAMQRVGIWDLHHKELSELSGGECQKVYLAMVLAQDTDLLLLDEPTAYLDVSHQLEFLRLLRELRGEGKTIVSILHDINGALQISDFLCVMNRGQAAFFGTPAELLDSKIIDKVFCVEPASVTIGESLFLTFPLSL